MENMMITTNENDIRQPFATVTTTIHNPFSYCAGHNSIIGEMTIVSEKWEIFGFDIVPFIDRTYNVTYNCSKHCLHLHCYGKQFLKDFTLRLSDEDQEKDIEEALILLGAMGSLYCGDSK